MENTALRLKNEFTPPVKATSLLINAMSALQKISLDGLLHQISDQNNWNIYIFERQLRDADQIISSIYTSREAGLSAMQNILKQFSTDWESIIKYYKEISVCLQKFEQYKNELSMFSPTAFLSS